MGMDELDGWLDEACQAVRVRYGGPPPVVGVVLGSGLGAFAESLARPLCIPYEAIPHMPAPTVVGHAGQLCLGEVDGVAVVCLQGRVHLYEGHSAERVVFGVRLLGKLGCQAVQLTNAAGGLHPSFEPGTFMLLTDHLNLTGRNPLRGPNPASLGPRFPDMTHTYDRELGQLTRQAATAVGLDLREGVYAALLGPSYETPAEIRMLHTLGADAVGMSTVPEAIALRHMGIRVSAISCITNLAAGIADGQLDHSEVERTARATRDSFVRLLTASVSRFGRALSAGGTHEAGA